MIKALTTYTCIAAACLLASCGNNASTDKPASDSTGATAGAALPDANLFKDSLEGKTTALYILRNKNNAAVAITNYGARVVSIVVPDRNGVMTDVALGYDSIGKYIHQPETYFGAIVGRYGNRIARGKFTLNGKALEEYFPNKVHQQLIKEPLVTTEKPETFDVIANLRGGGITGQAGALRLAIARALIAVDSEDRPALKKAGFLTRDPRVKERKKYGLKKARKAPQYSKR